MTWGEHRWSTSTKIECADSVDHKTVGCRYLCFREQCFDKPPDISVAGGMFVKGAVRTDPMTKGDVNVDDQCAMLDLLLNHRTGAETFHPLIVLGFVLTGTNTRFNSLTNFTQ